MPRHAVRRGEHRPPQLIDTRVVRAELARLRAPRPATTVVRERSAGTTLSGA